MGEVAHRRSLISHAVEEAIRAHAAPQVSASVLQLALRWARQTEIPEASHDLALFVEGPLRRAVEEVLGAEAAHTVCDELRPIAERVDEVTQVRKSRRPPPPELEELELVVGQEDFPEIDLSPAVVPVRSSKVTSPAPFEMPLVLVATQDPTKLSGLASALAGEAFVEPVRDALSLLDVMGSAQIVILDCERPAVRPETLIAVEPELPRTTCVVLWADEAALSMRLSRAGTSVPKGWVVSGMPASAEDVADLCRALRD